jgi:type IV pilus assembly protein PilX
MQQQRRIHASRGRTRQRGAALVVGLILLTTLTLLAISGMNTATIELVMAGNEQYRQKAFQASGTGVEQALTKLATVPQSGAAVKDTGTILNGDAEEKYATESQYLGDDLNIPGYSTGKFVGFHYQITSTGTSLRNASSLQQQGAYVIQSAGGGASFGSIL